MYACRGFRHSRKRWFTEQKQHCGFRKKLMKYQAMIWSWWCDHPPGNLGGGRGACVCVILVDCFSQVAAPTIGSQDVFYSLERCPQCYLQDLPKGIHRLLLYNVYIFLDVLIRNRCTCLSKVWKEFKKKILYSTAQAVIPRGYWDAKMQSGMFQHASLFPNHFHSSLHPLQCPFRFLCP